MKIAVLTFGIARDITGTGQLVLEMPEGSTVSQLKNQILAQYPRFESLASLLIAVNAEYGEEETILQEKDEIALIPPVSGG